MKNMNLLRLFAGVAIVMNLVACSEDEPQIDTPEIKLEIDVLQDIAKDEMLYVEGGTFNMGSQADDSTLTNYDEEANPDESHVHQVSLNGFYIGKYEVTQSMWEYVMKYSGVAADGTMMSEQVEEWWASNRWVSMSQYGLVENNPAFNVGYDEIVNVFIPRLNKITGLEFRLPTEAEWEYAARGGNKSNGYKYSGSNNVDEVACCRDNSNFKIYEVGSLAPNELGIYDMSGNVMEYCSDWYDENYYASSPSVNPTGPKEGIYKVARGGDFYNIAKTARVSARAANKPDVNSRAMNFGFRLALSAELGN